MNRMKRMLMQIIDTLDSIKTNISVIFRPPPRGTTRPRTTAKKTTGKIIRNLYISGFIRFFQL